MHRVSLGARSPARHFSVIIVPGVPGVVLLPNTRVTWACGVRQVSRCVTVLFVAVSTPVTRWQPRAA